MATFEEHIEGLTKVDITASTVPNQTELSTYLVNGIIDCVNKMTTLKPEELSKFSKTINAVDSVAKKGKILSVLREHDSTSILRVCTPIHPSLRYEATDIKSLHYRSKYNPGYYERDGLVICVPEASGSGNNDIVVTQVHYDTGLINSDEYNAGNVENFPLEYENLIALYAAAMVCNAKALDINNNMPTVPTVPNSPDYVVEAVSLPVLPVFNIEVPPFNIFPASNAIAKEDFDKADKLLSLFDKNVESYSKKFEEEEANYQKDLELYKSELENLVKDADRKVQVQNAEYTSEIERYSRELQFFKNDLEEAAVQYKWYSSQYITFINLYNSAIGVKQIPLPKEKKTQKTKSKGDTA
jgi:hypothetical protein